jgi:H+/Cl- antiporter ClcA
MASTDVSEMLRSNSEPEPPKLADERRWYAEHRALIVSTTKWTLLGTIAGICVGLGTRAFLWALDISTSYSERLSRGSFRYYFLLPLAMPCCVWLIRTFAPAAKGHGTEQVIAAVHKNFGRTNWLVAPVKLLATVLTLAFGGSVGKEGPCAQIGAAITSLFADLIKLNDKDRRKLVICGIGAGFAAVFGTPISGAIFGIEVLYVGQLEYPVLFPCLIAGIVSQLICGARAPVPVMHEDFSQFNQTWLILVSLVFGACFGIVALILIEMMRGLENFLRRFERYPYRVAAAGGVFLALLYWTSGDIYAGLGSNTIEGVLSGTVKVFLGAFLLKIIATAVTLETGGSGGIVTPLFFIGATAGAGLADLFHLPRSAFAAFGFVSVVAAAANTPIAASVMGLELLPPGVLGVYAALSACTAFLMVGQRSVYASQKLGFAKYERRSSSPSAGKDETTSAASAVP